MTLRQDVVRVVRGETTLKQLRARLAGLRGEPVERRSLRRAVQDVLCAGELEATVAREPNGQERYVLRRRVA